MIRPTVPVPVPVPEPVPAKVPSEFENSDQVKFSDHVKHLVSKKDYRKALEMFEQVPGCIKITAESYDALIDACIALSSRRFAFLLVKRYSFEHVHDSGSEFDIFLHNRLIYMNVKCGLVKSAHKLFNEMPGRNSWSFNIMAYGFVCYGHYWKVIELFVLMWKEKTDIKDRIFVSVLRAIAQLSLEYLGLQLHTILAKKGYFENNPFLFCALINLYAKCGCINTAQKMFDIMPVKTSVGYNTIIAGYALNGYSEKALDLYDEMKMTEIPIDMFTYATVIRVCVQLGSVEKGKEVHADLIRNGSALNLVVGTSLVDLYGKWGRMKDALKVFDQMPRKNVITWNALIGGFAYHGMFKEAFDAFDRMIEEGFVTNHVTVLGILNACVYAGNFEKGRDVFENMREVYKITPRAMHYACMIDLFGRKGLLKQALNLIQEAPFEPSIHMWANLVRACRAHNDTKLGVYAAEELCGLNPVKLSNYSLLIDFYVKRGRMKDASRLINEINDKGFELDVCYTWIEVNKKSYKFSVGDKLHPHKDEIYKKVHDLMREIGCEMNKLTVCAYHSEKLAIAFGLISTRNCMPLQLIQSHRICEDCHYFIGCVGLITKRDIVVRDASRFHHFSEGNCSCGNYW
ncbi:hypothetical protein LUZ60_002151 [Juncus effusus]|nr:hypothetical protein LUZ60_002151 [Juncus effusus]